MKILLFFIIIYQLSNGHGHLLLRRYIVPEPTFEVYNSQGFVIYLQHTEGMTSVNFQANLNIPIRRLQACEIMDDFVLDGGVWKISNHIRKLNMRDLLNYKISVVHNGISYQRDGRYRVRGKIIGSN